MKPPSHGARKTLWFAAVVGALACPTAEAAWVANGSLDLATEYDDNVAMAAQNKDDSMVTTASGRLEARRVTEQSYVSAIGGVRYVGYSDSHAGGDTLNNKDIEFGDLVARWRAERLSYGVIGTIRRDVLFRTVGYILDPLAPSADPGTTFIDSRNTDTTSGSVDTAAVDKQIRRMVGTANPFVGYQLSELTDVRLGYLYLHQDYRNGSQAGLQDSTTNGVTLDLNHAVSERNTISLSGQVARFDPTNDVSTDSYQISAGWAHKFSDVTGMSLEAGLSHADRNGQTDKGLFFRARGVRRTESGNFFLSAERSLYPTGYGLVETDRVNFGYDRRLSDTVRIALTGNAYKTDSGSGSITSHNARKYLSVGPRLTWRFTRDFSVGATYGFGWIDRRNEPGSGASGNSFGVFLSYSPASEI